MTSMFVVQNIIVSFEASTLEIIIVNKLTVYAKFFNVTVITFILIITDLSTIIARFFITALQYCGKL